MFARHRQLFLTGVFLLDGLLILRLVGRGLLGPLPMARPPGAARRPAARALPLVRRRRDAAGAAHPALLPSVSLGADRAALAGALDPRPGNRHRDRASPPWRPTSCGASWRDRCSLLFAILAALALCAAHLAIRVALRALRRRGRNLRHVLIVGTGELARADRAQDDVRTPTMDSPSPASWPPRAAKSDAARRRGFR